MFERFSDNAIQILVLAREEARALGHKLIGIETLIFGLISEKDGIAAQLLEQHGLTLEKTKSAVTKALGRGSFNISNNDFAFTDSAKLVLCNALEIADKLEHEIVKSEHILIGILQQDAHTQSFLHALDINLKELSASLSQYIKGKDTSNLPCHVYILVYNQGSDNEGIHVITHGDKDTVLLFERHSEAHDFSLRLEEQNFPIPTIEEIEVDSIIVFCRKTQHDWEFVPSGMEKLPPSRNAPSDEFYV